MIQTKILSPFRLLKILFIQCHFPQESFHNRLILKAFLLPMEIYSAITLPLLPHGITSGGAPEERVSTGFSQENCVQIMTLSCTCWVMLSKLFDLPYLSVPTLIKVSVSTEIMNYISYTVNFI